MLLLIFLFTYHFPSKGNNSLYHHEKQFLADVLQKRFLKNFENFTGKHLCWSLFLIKLQVCKRYEILKNTFFHRTRPVAAYVLFKGDTPMTSTLRGGRKRGGRGG